MSQYYFITGTDTEVGKTYVTTLLARTVGELGYRVACYKPVASGGVYQDGQLRNEDGVALWQAANSSQSYKEVNPFCFEQAIAPHIAAKEKGQKVTLEMVKKHACFPNSDCVFIEGAGGFLVPLNESESFSEIPLTINSKIILVVGMRLGCINHALLTLESIRSRGLEIAGWIANQVDKNMEAFEDNLVTLKNMIPEAYLGMVNYQGTRIKGLPEKFLMS
ncbi:dethiobiotin synthase [Pleionea sediminis]|uniref:dethiobiotin synthase n=1 Tax=Pleionea sediminis TaxID=2569479 RepID=UPI0011853A76|nr:dethiobiotin synthase [Pleionea sediminis]